MDNSEVSYYENMSAEQLPKAIAAMKKWDHRCKLARKTSSPKILELLHDDVNVYVRENVAANHSTLPENLIFIALYGGRLERLAVAQNPNVPPEAQTILVSNANGDNHLCSYVACNRNLCAKAAFMLFNNPHSGVRHNLMSNTKFVEHLQQKAVKDKICSPETILPLEWLIQLYTTK